jgi:hypothetical protein
VTWDWQAKGQTVGDSCVQGGNLIKSTVTYPDDTNWSQSQVLGPDPCGDRVVYAPSNWSATNAPNGASYNVLIGNQGGATPILDLSVNVGSVTIQTNGALAMLSGTTLTATNIVLQSDVSISGAGTLAAAALTKATGTGISLISPTLSLSNSVVSAMSGTLELNGGSGSGTLGGSTGAVIDLTGGQSATWSGKLLSAGAGTVRLNSGLLDASPALTLALTNPVLSWSGGSISGVLTNVGVVSVTASGSVLVNGDSTFYNAGSVQALGSQGVGLAVASSGTGAVFDNLAAGTLQFGVNDAVFPATSGVNPPALLNQGLLWKSVGTNVSLISVPFTNQAGSVEVDIGALSLNGGAFVQGGGTLTFMLGGAGAGQCGQLACGSLSLSGPLAVTLSHGFTPQSGSQFQIIAATNVHGTFSSVSVPSGLSVSYRTNGVFLVSAAGPSPVRLLSPHLSGGNLLFSFTTAIGQSYTIQYNTNLAGTNWLFSTNFTGDGSLFQFSSAVSNRISRLFYRVREP